MYMKLLSIIGIPSAYYSLTITESYGQGHGPMNYISAGHYPKQGVCMIYETD